MKKWFAVYLLLCAVMMPAMTVYAGNINEHEQRIVNAAHGTFEIDGVKYKAASDAISQLNNYLMQDDVDLTAEQADRAIANLPNYLREGLDRDALVPVNSNSDSSANSNTSSDENEQVIAAASESESKQIAKADKAINEKLEEAGLAPAKSLENNTADPTASPNKGAAKAARESVGDAAIDEAGQLAADAASLEGAAAEDMANTVYDKEVTVKKGVNFGVIAIIIVVVVIVAGGILVYRHRNRFKK